MIPNGSALRIAAAPARRRAAALCASACERQHAQRSRAPGRLHQHLRGGARADREPALLPPRSRTLSAASSRSSTSIDLSGPQIVALDEAQELAVLIADALHRHRGVRAGR